MSCHTNPASKICTHVFCSSCFTWWPPQLRSQRGLEAAIKILEDEFDKVESTKADCADLQNRKLPEADQKLLLVSQRCSRFRLYN